MLGHDPRVADDKTQIVIIAKQPGGTAGYCTTLRGDLSSGFHPFQSSALSPVPIKVANMAEIRKKQAVNVFVDWLQTGGGGLHENAEIRDGKSKPKIICCHPLPR